MSKIPTIAMIPSGYKANKLYSVLPTNGDADLATTRASTATRVNQLGLIEEVATGVPRLDYSDGGCPSLLVEPASTNLITYSEDFSDASWNLKTDINLTSGVTSPKGDNSAYLIEATANNGFIQGAITGTASVDYTHSFYIKPINVTGRIYLKQANGTLEELTLSDGWNRYEITSQGSTTTIRYGVTFENSGDSLHIWGAQLEEQSYATSYIPTTGTTATRVAETVSKTGLSSYINSSEGVLYVEIKALNNTSIITQRTIQLEGTGGSSQNEVVIQILSSSIRVLIYENSVLTLNHSFVIDLATYDKIAVKFSLANLSIFNNGTKVFNSDGAFGEILGLDAINFNRSGASPFLGKIKDLRVYNQALTDAELTTLTTL